MIKTVFIVGPTGIGKTEYAINYALENNGEIISADSMQIYKYLDIGSAKPSPEERAAVRHYLVDEIDPRDNFSVYNYKQLAMEYICEVHSKGKLPIVCGGTGLYVNALVYDMDFSAPEGDKEYRNKIWEECNEDPARLYDLLKKLDPKAAEKIHPNNIKRILRAVERLEKGEGSLAEFSSVEEESSILDCEIKVLSMDRNKLYDRINKRVEKLYDAGLEEEVRNLMKMGFTSEDVAMKGIGYKEIIDAINKGESAESAKELIKLNSRHYAKRQITWFKRYKQAEIIEV